MMIVHYDPTTLQVVQISSVRQPFNREGFSTAVVDGLPNDMGGGFAVLPATLRPAITDPACGAVIDAAKSVRPVEHEGRQYRFCCTNCAVKFFIEPEACLKDRPPSDEQWECCEVEALPAPPPPPPTLDEIRRARDVELAATDAYMVSDRPLDEWQQQEWRLYRQALRDLGSLPTAAERVSAWPVRPSGVDAIREMRARV